MLGKQPWPTKTDVHCWWCCHPFDSQPVPLPVHYDDKTNVFRTHGMFCSWSCAKAYSIRLNATNSPMYNELLYLLYKRSVPRSERGRPGMGIRCAPDKALLKVFGGTMSIEDFRKGLQMQDHALLNLLDSKVAYVNPSQVKSISVAPVATERASTSGSLNFENLGGTKNETMRLRRNKPLPGKSSNILEKVLGLKPSGSPGTGP